MINIVLFEPEIASNTGNIIRTCESFNLKLHLIRPYGFFLKDKVIKRCSTNHINLEAISEYDDLDMFLNSIDIDNNIFLFTKHGLNSPDHINFKTLYDQKEIYLIFGKESSGLPKQFIEKFKNNSIRIPMKENIVSINLSNTVAIGVYEVLRQIKYKGLV